MLTITQDEVKAVYEALVDATRVAFSAGETAVMVKTALEAARAVALAAGEVEGKNEAQREANLRQLLLPHYDALDAAERDARTTRHMLEMAKLGVEALRMRVRLAELTADAGEA